jgi:hypothetical protein
MDLGPSLDTLAGTLRTTPYGLHDTPFVADARYRRPDERGGIAEDRRLECSANRDVVVTQVNGAVSTEPC